MSLDIIRRFVPGVGWKYVEEEEGGGSSPVLLGPFAVAHDTPGSSLVLWNAKAGDLILDLFVITTITWSGGSQLEIYATTGGTDFLNPRRDSGDLQVNEDAGRYLTRKAGEKAYFGVSEDGQHSTPSLMKVNSDIVCDVLSPGLTGEALIWAVVVSA